MTQRNIFSDWIFRGQPLLSSRARETVRALRILRRAYEHVLLMATLEGARDVPRFYYQGYLDALELLGARAVLVARAL